MKGIIEDLKFRLLILSAYEQALGSLKERISQLGGDDPLAKQTRKLETDTAVSSIFTPLFDKYLEEGAARLSFEAAARVDQANPKESQLYKYLAYYAEEAGVKVDHLPSLERLVVSAAKKDAERAARRAAAPSE